MARRRRTLLPRDPMAAIGLAMTVAAIVTCGVVLTLVVRAAC
jgi:hypothetical protein